MKAVKFLHKRIDEQRWYMRTVQSRNDISDERAIELYQSAAEILFRLERMLIPENFVKEFEPYITW